MKLLITALALAVLFLTAGTIWLGARSSEDTVVANPYQQGLAYDEQRRALAPTGHEHAQAEAAPEAGCDLSAGPCTGTLGDLELTLDLGPRPPRAMAELAVQGRLSRGGLPVDGAEVALWFAMPRMQMGENVSRLAGAGGGRYQGKAVLVRCHSGRRDWRVTAAVRHGGEERRADFSLTLRE